MVSRGVFRAMFQRPRGAHIFQINACGFGTSDREEIRRNLADARKKVVCTTYRSLSLAVDCFEAGRCVPRKHLVVAKRGSAVRWRGRLRWVDGHRVGRGG